MNDHQSSLSQPSRTFDPTQQAPEHIQNLVSNVLTGEQNVLLHEFRYACHNTDLLPPALTEDTLVIVTEGQCDVQGRIVQPFHHYVTAQDIYLIPRGVPTEFHITGCYETINLFLNPVFMATVALEALGIDPARIELKERLGFHDPLIYAIGLALRDDIVTSSYGSRPYTASLNQSLALHLLYHYSSSLIVHSQPAPGLAASQLRQVMDYINDQFNRNLTLAELATVAGYSPAYFARQFKEATGLAPHQYLIRCRIERARTLLSNGELAIAEVAHRVGFADQSHLDRHFKHLLGVSPSMLLHDGKNVQDLSKNVQASSSPIVLQLK